MAPSSAPPSAKRRWLAPAAGLLLLGAAAAWWAGAEPDGTAAGAGEPTAERRARAERVARAAERVAELREESSGLMPAPLEGVALGMSLEELRRTRPRVAPDPKRSGDADGLDWHSEEVSGRSKAMYGLARNGEREWLERVQVLSKLPGADALAPHLVDMTDRYGPPTGLWRCPDTGGVPTLRLTWRREVAAASDVLLLYPGGIAQTLYIAPSETIGASLQRASCRPANLEDLRENPPVASPEQLEADSP